MVDKKKNNKRERKRKKNGDLNLKLILKSKNNY